MSLAHTLPGTVLDEERASSHRMLSPFSRLSEEVGGSPHSRGPYFLCQHPVEAVKTRLVQLRFPSQPSPHGQPRLASGSRGWVSGWENRLSGGGADTRQLRAEDNHLVPWAEQGPARQVISARACPRLSHIVASKKNLDKGKRPS